MVPLTAAVERIDGKNERAYFTEKQCGARYGFGSRHWRRLVDRGAAPSPTRFGRLTRWSAQSLLAWEASGCKPIRAIGKAV